MSAPSPGVSWRPAADEEPTWFKPGGSIPTHPTPLELSFQIYAFAFGVSRALESLYFPLYEMRTRLVDGELYLASVPSAMAESDLPAHLSRMRDSGIRFTRSVRGIWERAIRGEVEEYNEHMAAFAPADASDRDVASGLPRLRRTRANQWFAATRAIFAPTAMLQAGIGSGSVDEGREVTREALDAVQARGGTLLDNALGRVAERLVRSGALVAPEDIRWLDYHEVGEALASGRGFGSVVAERKAAAATQAARRGPDTLGPDLPGDAPRMYLLREVLALIG